jgi:isoleucyl-tRNA synthetase
VAGEDYREDIRISPEILTRLAESYRKIRNTWRFLLGNISDFDPSRDWVSADQMLPLDRYALLQHGRGLERIKAAYDDYTFHVVMQNVIELCTVDLSAFYLDILKDRLYASAPGSLLRRSAQTAMYLMARDLLLLCAPVLCFTSEEAWAVLPKLATDPESVHLAYLPASSKKGMLADLRREVAAQAVRLDELYRVPLEVRRQVLAALEEERRKKQLGSSVEALVTIRAPHAEAAALRALGELSLAELYIVSGVRVLDGQATSVEVTKAQGTKCGRCWLYREDVGAHAAHAEVCGRCAEVLASLPAAMQG